MATGVDLISILNPQKSIILDPPFFAAFSRSLLSQAFKELDKPAALAAMARDTWSDAIESDRAVREPERLLRFLLLTFADLKKSAFLNWFAFPTLGSHALFRLSSRPAPATSVFESPADASAVVKGLAGLWARSVEASSRPGCPPFFVVVRGQFDSDTAGRGGGDKTPSIGVLSLLEYEEMRKLEDDGGDVNCTSSPSSPVFGLIDPSTDPGGMPGWPLRNFLVLLSARWGVKRANVLCFREYVPRASSTGSSALLSEQSSVDGEFCFEFGFRPTSLTTFCKVMLRMNIVRGFP